MFLTLVSTYSPTSLSAPPRGIALRATETPPVENLGRGEGPLPQPKHLLEGGGCFKEKG